MNRLTMGQYNKVLLAIDNAHYVPQRALGCRCNRSLPHKLNIITVTHTVNSSN